MTRITNSDQLAILLRQQLSQLSRRKTDSASSAAKKQKAKTSASGLSRVQEIVASEGFNESEVERALIQGLLAEEMGDGLMNEAKFQQLIDHVHKTIAEDPAAMQILKDSLQQVAKQK